MVEWLPDLEDYVKENDVSVEIETTIVVLAYIGCLMLLGMLGLTIHNVI